MHTDIRPAQSAQRASLTERYGVHDERLTAALELMESHPGEPLERVPTPRGASGFRRASSTGCSPRSWGPSYAEHYRRIRLERARDLLRQSAVPITEIALGCGFSSASHFSRAYREAFRGDACIGAEGLVASSHPERCPGHEPGHASRWQWMTGSSRPC